MLDKLYIMHHFSTGKVIFLVCQGDKILKRRLVLKKLFFCVGEYAEYGFDQQG